MNTFLDLLSLAIQAIFIENILLFYFLGMCSYLACSSKLSTASGLGFSVFVVITLSGIINWTIHHFITKKGALSWLPINYNFEEIDLTFLDFIIFISVIASLVQVLEIFLDRFIPPLYRALGVYLPLITVNCAILGASLFAIKDQFTFVPNTVFVASTGLGWWLAIIIIGVIREKLTYSDMPKGLEGMAITFILTGLIALSFLGFAGISLVKKDQLSAPVFYEQEDIATNFLQNPDTD